MTENEFKNVIEAANQFTDEWNKKANVKKKWRGTNPYYVGWYNQQRLVMSELLYPLWDTLQGKQLLDFGCGTGFESYFLMNLGAETKDIKGIDINTNLIAEGRKQNPNLEIITYDGNTIPFDDNTFDLAVCIVVFSSIPDGNLRKRLASELKRVLKPGGYIYWMDLNRMVAGNPSETLHPAQLWPDLAMKFKQVGAYPSPGSGLRGLRGLKKLLLPLLNKMGYAPTHLAALIGPK